MSGYHVEPIVSLQPSLHTDRHFCRLVADTAEVYTGTRVADDDEIRNPEWIDEIIRECIDALTDHGYGVVYQDDSFLVWEGEVPQEWRDN